MSSFEQYLTLRVGEAIYGITIDKVREVVSYTAPSPMPNSSACMIGVIKLRGRAVPVLDLRLKFGLTKTAVTVDTCIIILELERKCGNALLGITADMVQQVAEFEEDDLEPSPQLADGSSADWIQAMARFEEGFVIILDIEKTLAKDILPTVENDILVQEG
jgi:purine-binding chemotaxis protein CheW